MYVIIVGCGKVGSRFASILSDEGHDVVIVDNDSSTFERLDDDYTGLKILGVPIDQDVLKKAGIENADALVAVTTDDNINIMVCQIAKDIYKVKKTIARIYNPSREYVFHQFGMDTICPTNTTVSRLKAMILNKLDDIDYTLGKTKISIHQEIPNKVLYGKKVSEIELDENTRIFGIEKGERFFYAEPQMVIEKGDILIISSITE